MRPVWKCMSAKMHDQMAEAHHDRRVATAQNRTTHSVQLVPEVVGVVMQLAYFL